MDKPRNSNPSTSTLVTRAQAGDNAAWDELIRRHLDYLRRHLSKYSRDPGIRDELEGAVLMQVSRSLGSLRKPSSFKVWLRAVARHEALHYRQRQRRNEQIVRQLEPLHVQQQDPQLLNVWLRDLSAQVTDELLEPWLMHRLLGYPLAEIAEARSVSVATLKRRLKCARSSARALRES